jgi:hypothetical protein
MGKKISDITARALALDTLIEHETAAGLSGKATLTDLKTLITEGVDPSTLEGRVTAAENDIDALQAVDTAYDGRLDALEAADITLDGRLDTAESDINTLESADTALDGRLDVLEAALAVYTKPTLATFATSVQSPTASDNSFGILLSETPAGTGANNVRSVYKAIPGGANWTAIAKFGRGWITRDFVSGGLVLRESGTAKIIAAKIGGAATQEVGVDKWTNATTFSASYANWGDLHAMEWIKLVVDAANYTWYVSSDGHAWAQILAATAKNNFFTTAADQIGFYLNTNVSAGALLQCQLAVLHYAES